MAKTSVVPITLMDHNKDTIITLTKSNKQILIKKTFPADKIKLSDDYMSTHKITTKTNTIVPNALQCGVHYEKYWVMQDQYKAVSGKYLGIWNNYVTYQKLHDTYGFRMLYVTNTTDIDNARSAGFQYDSLMLGLSSYSSAFNQIDQANSGGRHVGYYYIDEPIEHGTWDDYTIEQVADYVYPKDLMLSSYKWPSWYYSFPQTWGDVYGPIISFSNIYIMCDQYYGDCEGNTDAYWTKYRGYYGSSNCIMNWVHVVINNGSGRRYCGGVDVGAANSWYDLLGDANENGVNRFWLYALSTGDETAIKNFCYAAWQRGWLLRLSRHYVERWECASPNPCIDCQWPDGQWYIASSYYDGNYQWVSY